MGKLKEYIDQKKFWLEASPYLRREEAKNSLYLGLSYAFRSDSSNCLYQSVLIGKGTFFGAVMCSRHQNDRNLIVSPINDVKHASALYKGVLDRGIPITGLIGERDTVNLYRRILKDNGIDTVVRMSQGIYRCSAVRLPEYPSELKFRQAKKKDINTIGRWIEDFQEEALPYEQPVCGSEYARQKVEKGMIFVLEKSDELLSMVGWSRDIETSCSVNLVFTPKCFRKNGYASIVTAKLTQHILKSGRVETNLYTDMLNPTSNKIYQDIGYEFVCDSLCLGIVK